MIEGGWFILVFGKGVEGKEKATNVKRRGKHTFTKDFSGGRGKTNIYT